MDTTGMNKNNKDIFIETVDNKYINLKHMVMAKKMMDCYWIYSNIGIHNSNFDLNIVCESDNKKSYEILDKYIKDKTI